MPRGKAQSKAQRLKAAREGMRRLRARRKAEAPKGVELDPFPEDPAQALADWSKSCLKVPPGHPLAGQPMELPDYGVAFLRDAMNHRESLLCISRKCAKSAIIAVYLLARLVGPLRVRGWRGGVVSVTKEKAGELKRQMQEIAEASCLEGLRFLRSPAPGRVESATGTLDVLSADKSAGHSAGFSDALVDELGLLEERDRALVSGMRSSVSARNGRFIALSIQGAAPFTAEMLARKDAPGVAVHHYAAPADCAVDDEAAWHAANPGLAAGIKSIEYMRHEAARVLATPTDAASFRAFDLNQPQDPADEMVCQLSDWKRCVVPEGELPPREGTCYLAIDLGASQAMSAATALWESGRLESWAAFAGIPNLRDRERADGCDGVYQRMAADGQLKVFDNTRVVPVSEFLLEISLRIGEGQRVIGGSDRYRAAEAQQALAAAGRTDWLRNWSWRGTGASSAADGSHDLRSLQSQVLTTRIYSRPSLLLAAGFEAAVIRRDSAGNPALAKQKASSRIDVIQALAISCGLRALNAASPTQGTVYHGAV